MCSKGLSEPQERKERRHESGSWPRRARHRIEQSVQIGISSHFWNSGTPRTAIIFGRRIATFSTSFWRLIEYLPPAIRCVTEAALSVAPLW